MFRNGGLISVVVGYITESNIITKTNISKKNITESNTIRRIITNLTNSKIGSLTTTVSEILLNNSKC